MSLEKPWRRGCFSLVELQKMLRNFIRFPNKEKAELMPKNIARTAKIQLNERHLMFESICQAKNPFLSRICLANRQKKAGEIKEQKNNYWINPSYDLEGYTDFTWRVLSNPTWPHPISIIANYSPMTFFLFFFQLYYRGSCLLWSSWR